MKTVAALNLAVALCLAGAAAPAAAAAAKKPAKAKAKAEPSAPLARQDEIDKLKGAFKWGMTVEQVESEIGKRIEASYADKVKRTVNDPTQQDRIRKQAQKELDAVKKKYIKFDGQKTGFDASIVDQEFSHGTNESMLQAKEDNSTRYFFFSDEHLYKMFIAFDKDMLKGKTFREFGQVMQARLGKAAEVYVDEKSKAGVKHQLDHFAWASKEGDGLRLVDRSEFYDVYCLVIFDRAVAGRLADARKFAHPGGAEKTDSLVEAVLGSGSASDPNDNVVDRIVGKETKRPGDEKHDDIVVPRTGVKAPTAAEVNRKDKAEGTSGSSSGSSGGEEKPAAAKGGLQF